MKYNYYSDNDKEKIRPELLDKEASNKAKTFRNMSRERRVKGNDLTGTQLRKFYGEFKRLETKWNNTKSNNIEKKIEEFATIKPFIKMQKSKVAYAANPMNRKIPDTFKTFLTDHINSIEDFKDFKAFMLHFEAVVGFYYGFGLSNN